MPFSFLPRMIFPHLTDVTAEALRARGILVRWFDSDRIRDYVRITVGSMEQMEALIDALTALLEAL